MFTLFMGQTRYVLLLEYKIASINDTSCVSVKMHLAINVTFLYSAPEASIKNAAKFAPSRIGYIRMNVRVQHLDEIQWFSW